MQSKTGEVGRYAPSTTGPAHPGTLLAALLCWLDARDVGARVILRLEDLDPDRCKPVFSRGMVEALDWFGLEWDAVHEQHTSRPAHEAALDELARNGRLYPCTCSRAEIKRAGERSPDGGFRYPGTCRNRALPTPERGGWRTSVDPLRVRIPDGRVEPFDEGGLDLGQDPAACFGDPVVRRRDGAIAYHLASVVDDAAVGVTRIVRGRDLAASTATQWRLRELLGLPQPRYRHHLLLLESHGQKLAKLHGAVGFEALRQVYRPASLCGLLAFAAGLRDGPCDATPEALRGDFSWSRVAREDRLASWDGERLSFRALPKEEPPQ